TRGLSPTFHRRGEPTRTTRIQRGLSRVCLARCREIGDAYNNSRHGMQREPLQRERLRSRHCRRMMTQYHSPHPPRLRNDDALRCQRVSHMCIVQGEAKTSTSDSTKSSESEPDSPATNVFATTSQSYCVAFADEYTEDTEDHQTEQKS
ncbi:hypothetical protein E4U12_008514, partial [Claviceps purpurea]